MIKHYLRERRSWILLVLFMHALLLFIAWLDAAVPFHSILYYVFLSLLVFAGFTIIRFHQETAFYRRLKERENNLDLSTLYDAESPFEQIVERSMTDLAGRLKESASRNQMSLEQEKDELLAWIHEVKTPLTAMRLIMDRLDDEPLKAALTYEWLRIHLLLDQQLHRKRLPSMENDLYMEQVDLESLFFAEIKPLQTWCMQKRIGFDLRLEVAGGLSDGKWLAFIIRQLLTNAIKYSGSGAPDITVKSFRHMDRTILEVKDYGCGIEARDLPRIFDHGFTGATRHQDSAATGMGLYLAQKAAKALHIHMAAESEPGMGTTFRLTFPKPNEIDRITGM